MEEHEIVSISKCENLDEITQILLRFLGEHEKLLNFPYLNIDDKRVLLWSALFECLQKDAAAQVHPLCLAAIRILSRDKSQLEKMICEKWILTLIDKADLYKCGDETQENSLDVLKKDVILEALKCLNNLAYNSEVARALCASTSIAEGLLGRGTLYKEISCKDDVMLFDMRLLFILTALRHDIKNKVKHLQGMEYLMNCLKDLLSESSGFSEIPSCSGSGDGVKQCSLAESQQAIVCEILKVQFNLISQGADVPADDAERAIYLKLITLLRTLLLANASSEEKTMEMHSNVANLLTSVPPLSYLHLTPELKEGDAARNIYDGRDMDALQSLVQLLEYRLSLTIGTTNQYEILSPILTVLNQSSRSCRSQRKYLRQVVLPPLRDVSLPPEKGSTLRNKLCKLLTTPVTSVRDLVAEFLFILCKEKVGRMVKYTGFGNAAGHLAQKGLLGGGRGADYSSSSDDSDTEEYLEAQPNIDPVVGCTRPPRVNPFEGMTEEQKEHEAMKLVNLFDKMVSAGVVKPARIGPDGRPQAVEHVLELRENPPNRPQS